MLANYIIVLKMNNRLYYNLKLLHILRRKINENPDLRFQQLLWNLGIENGNDRFYEESKITYNKVINNLNF